MAAFRSVLAAVLLVLGTAAALAAPNWTEYSPAAFQRAQAAGKTILVDVHAVWCPTCKKQDPILDELRGETALKDVLFVKVDFDREKEFLRAHRIPRQSTVLVFKGRKEVARSTAETDRGRLRGFVLGAAGEGE